MRTPSSHILNCGAAETTPFCPQGRQAASGGTATPWHLQWILRFQKASCNSPVAGLTLLECLVAMVIISVIVVAITPPIFLVTATRVQNRRAEQANQIAQAEMDRVRTLVERGVYTAADLPADIGANLSAAPVASAVFGQLKSTNPASNTYLGATVPGNSLLPVDVDGDGRSDFLVQVYRTTGVGGAPPLAFQVGVRVYSDNPTLRQNLGSLNPALQQKTSLKMASGLGSQGIQPLAVLNSTLVRNDAQNSLPTYRNLCTATNC